jgi:anti-anti-sigma factor
MSEADMLRIFPGTSTGSAVVLRLEGQVSGRWVEQLRRSCDEALQANGAPRHSLVLDLAEVSFIDANGLELFRELSSRHVTLSNCSLFAAELLKGIE